MEVTPKLRYRELTWVLGVKVLQDSVRCSAGDAQKVATKGLEV